MFLSKIDYCVLSRYCLVAYTVGPKQEFMIFYFHEWSETVVTTLKFCEPGLRATQQRMFISAAFIRYIFLLLSQVIHHEIRYRSELLKNFTFTALLFGSSLSSPPAPLMIKPKVHVSSFWFIPHHKKIKLLSSSEPDTQTNTHQFIFFWIRTMASDLKKMTHYMNFSSAP